MPRWLAQLLCIVVVGGWWGAATATSLGEVTLNSVVGEPISATIQVELGDAEDVDRIAARIASPDTHTAYGLNYDPYLTSMTVKLLQRGGKTVLILGSNKLLREPYLEFVVELRLLEGSVLRSYTLLPAFDLRQAGAVAAETGSSPPPGATRPATAAVKPVDAGKYTVQPLDSIWLIAAGMDKALGNVNDRIRLLRLSNPGIGGGIHAGDVLLIPTDRSQLSSAVRQAVTPSRAAPSASTGPNPNDLSALPFVDEEALAGVRRRAQGYQAVRLAAVGGPAFAQSGGGDTSLVTSEGGEPNLALELEEIRKNLASLAAENAELSADVRRLQQRGIGAGQTVAATESLVSEDADGLLKAEPAPPQPRAVDPRPGESQIEPQVEPNGVNWLLWFLLVLVLLVATVAGGIWWVRRRNGDATFARSDAEPAAEPDPAAESQAPRRRRTRADRLDSMKARTVPATPAEEQTYEEGTAVQTPASGSADVSTDEGAGERADANAYESAYESAYEGTDESADEGGDTVPAPADSPVAIVFDDAPADGDGAERAVERGTATEAGVAYDPTQTKPTEGPPVEESPDAVETGIAFEAPGAAEPAEERGDQPVRAEFSERAPEVKDGIDFDPTPAPRRPPSPPDESLIDPFGRGAPARRDGIDFEPSSIAPSSIAPSPVTSRDMGEAGQDDQVTDQDALEFDMPISEPELDEGFGDSVEFLKEEDFDAEELEIELDFRADDEPTSNTGAEPTDAEEAEATLGDMFDRVALTHSMQADHEQVLQAQDTSGGQSRWWALQQEWDRVFEDAADVVTSTAVYYIQMDNHESLEDQLGSLKMEEMTLQVQALVQRELSESGQTLHRIKDNTFLFLSSYVDEHELKGRGETLVRIVRMHVFMADGGRVPITLSIAIVPFSGLYNKLDDYLNRGKLTVARLREESGDQNAGDGVTIDREGLQTINVDDEDAFAMTVDEFLDEGMFEVQYQTLINLLGAEEKVYLCKTELSSNVDPGTLPDDFLKRAFSCRATPAIDRYAIRTFLDKILQLGGSKVKMLFRIDIRSAMDNSFQPWLLQQLSARNVDAASIILFVYADDVVSHKPHLTRFSSQLRRHRIRIGMLNVDYDSVHLQAAIDVGATMIRVRPGIVDEVVESSATFGARAVSSGTRESARLREFLNDFHQHNIETVLFSTYNEAIPGLVVVNATNLRATYIQTPIGMIEDDLL